MAPLQKPARPGKLSALPPEEQAREAIRLYQSMANYAGRCMKTRDPMIQWINQVELLWGE